VHAKHVRQFLDSFAILWRKQQNAAIFRLFLVVYLNAEKFLTTFACTPAFIDFDNSNY
jgi:hypothetical protein